MVLLERSAVQSEGCRFCRKVTVLLVVMFRAQISAFLALPCFVYEIERGPQSPSAAPSQWSRRLCPALPSF